MKISEATMGVLRNFSDINNNILFKPGKSIATMSTMKNIMAKADVAEEFESEFGVYDLPEFLRALDSFAKPVLKFNGSANLQIKDESSSLSARYAFADKSTLVVPTKEIQMPDKTVTFTLKNSDYDSVKKLYTNLSLPDIAFKGENGKIKLVALDKKNSNSNTSSIEVGTTDIEFTAYIKAENMKIIPGEYDVALSKAKIAHFIYQKVPRADVTMQHAHRMHVLETSQHVQPKRPRKRSDQPHCKFFCIFILSLRVSLFRSRDLTWFFFSFRVSLMILFIAEKIRISSRSSITSRRLEEVNCMKGTKVLLPRITI